MEPSSNLESQTQPGFRAGFVALAGRPNVGKSSLLNAMIGESLAVATPRPQTTRERMLGIWTTERFQIVLVDTPGIHRAKSALNKYMVAEALRAAKDVDLLLFLAEVPKLPDAEAAEQWEPGPVVCEALELLAGLGRPMLLVLTKIDVVPDKRLLLPVVDKLGGLQTFAAILPTSARTGEGLRELENALVTRLPEHPPYYDTGSLSDRAMRWHAAELVRAEIFEELGEELPYSCAVTVESYREQDDKDVVRATIHVERDSQKGMVIGRGGTKIKAISMGARKRIEGLTGKPCELFLQVRVTPNWTRDPDKLEQLGYRREDE